MVQASAAGAGAGAARAERARPAGQPVRRAEGGRSASCRSSGRGMRGAMRSAAAHHFPAGGRRAAAGAARAETPCAARGSLPAPCGRAVAGARTGAGARRPARAVAAPGECRVRVTLAGVCATDLALARGYMGFVGVAGHEFIGVALDGPLAGRRVVGEINAGCGACPECATGDARHCPRRTVLGSSADRAPSPKSCCCRRTTCWPCPTACATSRPSSPSRLRRPAPRGAGAGAGEASRLVAGDGRLGLLCAHALALAGAHVTVAGRHPEHAELLPAGARHVTGWLEEDGARAICSHARRSSRWRWRPRASRAHAGAPAAARVAARDGGSQDHLRGAGGAGPLGRGRARADACGQPLRQAGAGAGDAGARRRAGRAAGAGALSAGARGRGAGARGAARRAQGAGRAGNREDLLAAVSSKSTASQRAFKSRAAQHASPAARPQPRPWKLKPPSQPVTSTTSPMK